MCLGRVDRLPLEIFSAIILLLNIVGVDQLKGGSRRAPTAAHSRPQLKPNWEAHDTRRGIRAIKIRQTITVEGLFGKLRASQYPDCGEYCGYMYLATLERVCSDDSEKSDLSRRSERLRFEKALPHFRSPGSIFSFLELPGSDGEASFMSLFRLKDDYTPWSTASPPMVRGSHSMVLKKPYRAS